MVSILYSYSSAETPLQQLLYIGYFQLFVLLDYISLIEDRKIYFALIRNFSSYQGIFFPNVHRYPSCFSPLSKWLPNTLYYFVVGIFAPLTFVSSSTSKGSDSKLLSSCSFTSSLSICSSWWTNFSSLVLSMLPFLIAPSPNRVM
jgi:hypothetical protein